MRQATRYRKAQTGWLIIWIFIPVLILNYVLYHFQWGDRPLSLTPFVILTVTFIFIILLFYQLTVVIDGTVLKVVYGIGLIRLRFNMDQVIEVNAIKTPWYYGWGIRITPKGMLYNIQGSGAVAVRYLKDRKERFVMIGSPEPEALKTAIENINGSD